MSSRAPSRDVNLSFAASIDRGVPSRRDSLHAWEQKWGHWWLAAKIVMFFMYFVVGYLVFNHFEDWDPFKSISFAIATMTTIGYGYRHPTSDESRMFTIFYLIIGVGIVYFYVAKAINERFVHALVSSQSITQPELVGQKYVHHRRWMVFYILSLIGLVVFGGLCLQALEPDWSFITSIYFAVVTISTVGYGDITIDKQHTHIFLAVFIISSTVLSAVAFNNFQLLQAQNEIIRQFNERLEREKDLSPIVEDKESLSEAEFVLAVLQCTGRLDANDIVPWVAKFQNLKLDANGRANRENIDLLIAQESKNAARAQELLEIYTQMPLIRALRGEGDLFLPRQARNSKATELSYLIRLPLLDNSNNKLDA